MNSKKIALITMLVVFLVLILFTVFFARFVLEIDFGKDNDSTSVSQQEQIDREEPQTDEPESEEQDKPNREENKEDGDSEDKKPDEQDKDKEKEQEEKEELFAPASAIKSAEITLQEESSYQMKTEDTGKLNSLLKELEALKPKAVQQSVGIQDASWQASLNLSMEDGTAVSCRLYESAISGSKTTLSDGAKTYESTASTEKVKALLQSWKEEDQKANAPKIAQEEFMQASRVLAANPFTMEVQNIAQSSASLQAALGDLKVIETYSGNVNPGVEYNGTNIINLTDDTSTLFTLEFYENGILAYRSEKSKEFYVCEENSLNAFYQTVEQICSQYSAQPAQLSMMDFGALSGMEVYSTTGSSKTKVGLIRDHAQTLFGFLQQLHVKKGSMREEGAMFKRPEYHAEIAFENGTQISVDINKGSLLIQGSDGVIRHYTLIGDDNLELVRAEFERVTQDD